MFKQNEYIVILRDAGRDTKYFKHGYCFVQRENKFYFNTAKDLTGKPCGASSISFDNKSLWRYATPEEIAEYDRLGKPFDVTTLKSKELSKEELLEEAKRRYPLGTYFKSPDDGYKIREVKPYTIGSNITWEWSEETKGTVIRSLSGLFCQCVEDTPACSNPHVYKNGIWAEIVSTPKAKTEELTSLPEKWVVRNPWNEETEKLYAYANVHGAIPPYSNGTWFHFPSHEGCTTRGEIAPGYTEITFDQFKKWVLKSSDEVPEYVECIQKDTLVEVGTIYKVSKTGGPINGHPTYIISGKRYLQSYFKPSTKEAYEAQQNPQPSSVKPTTVEPEWTPQVGEWVVVLSEDPHYYNCEQGKAQLMWRIDGEWINLLFSDGTKNGYRKVRKALPHEIPSECGPGIIHQIESVKDYGVLTEEKIRGFVSDLFYTPSEPSPKVDTALPMISFVIPPREI
jgi:hypothetical protein